MTYVERSRLPPLRRFLTRRVLLALLADVFPDGLPRLTDCSRGADVPAQEEAAETPTQPNIIVVLGADLDRVLAERMPETRSLLVEEVPPPKTLLSATQYVVTRADHPSFRTTTSTRGAIFPREVSKSYFPKGTRRTRWSCACRRPATKRPCLATLKEVNEPAFPETGYPRPRPAEKARAVT